MKGALNGVRVIDLTQFESGTSCTQMLAWLGAEVIKIEEPTRGEQGRGASSEKKGADSYYFMMLNNSKRSVTLNLKSDKGKELLKKLIAKGDIFAENFAPGAIERLGFSWDIVNQLNPRMIYAQIKGFAPGSKYEHYPSFDMIAQAAGGTVSVTGEPDGIPLKPGITVGDTGTALHCVIGILAALYQRQLTGKGQKVVVAMQDAVLNFCRIAFARQYISNGVAAPRVANQGILGMNSPSGVYPCKGGGSNDYCFVYTTRAADHQWLKLLKFIGKEEWADDPRFATQISRWEHRELIDAAITAWTSQHDKIWVMETLGSAGVPAAAVMDTAELTADPKLRRDSAMATVQHPVRGEFILPGWAVQMSESTPKITPAPLLGDSTDDVYQKLLGLSPADIASLRAEKVI